MSATLDILGSSSHGNAYVIHAGNERLLIECGVPFKKVLPLLWGESLANTYVIASHQHKDHLGYYKQYLEYTLPIYSSDVVAEMHEGIIGLKPKAKYRIGGFQIMPLEVPHGDCPNYAYVIDHPDTGRIVFATDCEDFPYDIPDVTTLMIEANYSEEILLNKALDGEEIRSRSETHMEINRCVAVVERLCSPKLRRVVLLHLSDGFSDERAFISQVREVVGDMVEVYAADKGMRVSLDKDWF